MKLRNIFFIILAVSTLFISFNVDAKTLRDLKNELAVLKEKKQNSENDKKLTENELSEVNKSIEETANKIVESEKTIEKLNDDIIELTIKAEERELEIKEIMHFLQISSGESAYLEYIFGAKDITDFIYRSAISGQLVSYNEKLIDEYNDTIIENQKKQSNLKEELVKLDLKQQELQIDLEKLGSELASISDVSMSIDEEIEAQEKAIYYYEKTLGCKLDENINSCGNVPYSGSFTRPVTSGRITSSFGYRCYTRNNGTYYCGYHNGIDLSGGDSRIYASAPGTVAGILWQQSCGGNKVFIHHNVGGNYYTTGYYHLKSINVKVGDYVDQNTVIGIMGGGPDTWWYDKCTTGAHLHFSVATGLYLKDYSSWSTFESRNINPTTVVNFPGAGVWFSNRVYRY